MAKLEANKRDILVRPTDKEGVPDLHEHTLCQELPRLVADNDLITITAEGARIVDHAQDLETKTVVAEQLAVMRATAADLCREKETEGITAEIVINIIAEHTI